MWFGSQDEFKVGRKKAKEIIKKILDRGRCSFEIEAFRILEFYGIDVAEFAVARSKADVYYIINDIGLPVVLKAVSISAIHREDLEAVVVVKQKEDVERAYPKALGEIASNLPWLPIEGVLVQKYIPWSEKFSIILVRDKVKAEGYWEGLDGVKGSFSELDYNSYPFLQALVVFFKDIENLRKIEADFVKSDDGRWYLVDAKCYLFEGR